MSLGSKIRTAREFLGLSQLALALRCGWDSQSRIGNYEKDLREPGINDLKKMARALERPVTYFLEIEGEYTKTTLGEGLEQSGESVILTNEEQIFLSLFKELTESQRAGILGEIQAVYQLNEEVVATYRQRNQVD